MSNPPSGTVTFLFTDIEGSTRLWEQHPEAMRPALARHDALLRGAIEANNGYVFNTVGDAFCAAFANPGDALAAALAGQRALHAADWGEVGAIKVRAALHTGVAEAQSGDYLGLPLSRVARLLGAAHGGQTLLSQVTEELVRDHLPAGVSLRDMGERRLKDLTSHEHIYQLIASDLPAEFPPLRTLDLRRNNLPAQATSFVGRQQELATLLQLLRRPSLRLLTLTGPGGTGKTRLSLQAAANLLDEFEGVYFVALATISAPSLVAPAIAQTLGVKEEAGQSQRDALKAYLHDHQTLLVLDNFEQVVTAAPLLNELLQAAPRLKLLVSSREVLHLYGEQEYGVPPLALPDLKNMPGLDQLEQYAAIALFTARANAARYDFALTSDNAAAVAGICTRLDGLPLAIELAAARVKLLTPQHILAELDHRLKLLTSGARDLPARQRSLRGAIDWSYNLLTAAEQQLFARLAVFVGGFTPEAVEAVCGDPVAILNFGLAESGATHEDSQTAKSDLQNPKLAVFDILGSLVDKSLLRQEAGADAAPRFMMLETIREYALERLADNRAGRYAMQKAISEYAAERLAASGEEEQLRHRHAEFYSALAKLAESKLRGSRQAEWLARLQQEHDNIRAALGWLLQSNQTDAALRLAGAMGRFWYVRNYLTEGRNWLDAALKGQAANAQLRAKALTEAGRLAWIQGDYAIAEPLLQESLSIKYAIADQQSIPDSLTLLGGIAWSQGNYTQARTQYEAVLAIQRVSGDEWGVAASLNNLGLIALVTKDYAAAHTMYAASLTTFRKLDDKRSIASLLTSLGFVVIQEDEHEEAVMLLQEAIAIFEELGDQRGVAAAISGLSESYAKQQDLSSAVDTSKRGLRLYHAIGDKSGIADTFVRMAGYATTERQWLHAARLQAAGEMLRKSIGASPTEGGISAYAQMLTESGTLDDPAEFAAAWDAGQAMTIEQAVAYALGDEEPSIVAELLPMGYNYVYRPLIIGRQLCAIPCSSEEA